MANKFNFDKVSQRLQKVKQDVPAVIAAATTKHFLGNFANEAFESDKWQDVQRHQRKGGSSRNQSKILVQSGALRRAVAGSLVSATWDKIKYVVTDVVYAAVHNYGLRAGRGAGFKMPQRKFMGDSPELRKLQLSKLKSAVDKIWKA